MSNAREISPSAFNNANRNFEPIAMPIAHAPTPPPANSTNAPRNLIQNIESAATEADEHEIFGELVVREMRKMTPEAKKIFKRDVTQLMYS